MKITASDRSSLIRLASSLPSGSEEKRAILSGLSKVGMEFDTKEALEAYLKEHPGADKSLHSVKKEEKGKKSPKGPGSHLKELGLSDEDLEAISKAVGGDEEILNDKGSIKKGPDGVFTGDLPAALEHWGAEEPDKAGHAMVAWASNKTGLSEKELDSEEVFSNGRDGFRIVPPKKSKKGSVVDKLEALVGGDLKVGRNMIKGYPVDIDDLGQGLVAVRGVDLDASQQVLKILRREGFSPSFDKKSGRILVSL